MKATLLDKRDDGIAGVCYLSKIKLADYIAALPNSYQQYEIQREVVTNTYLDRLVETVLNRRHIPSIVLIADRVEKRDGNELEIAHFKILDGLQRTSRLHAIGGTIAYCLQHIASIKEAAKLSKYAFSKRFSGDLAKINSNTTLLRSVFDFYEVNGQDKLNECLAENSQWFEVWTGLSPDEEVRKMLTLNAGHKPVKTRHQLELLFLYLLPRLQSSEASHFELVREREISATQFSKNREIGQFHFAHVITALLSFAKGKPIAPSTGLIQQINDEEDLGENPEVFRPNFLDDAVEFLVKFDRALTHEYGDLGSLWFGREVVFSGVFGALGAYSSGENASAKVAFDKLLSKLPAHPGLLNLDEFEKARNNLDLSKVNIGNANRAAIYQAMTDVLHDRTSRIDWLRYFGGVAG